LAKKKSPTSAWQRFISSTRKTQRKLAAACNSPGVADAAAAEVAEAAAAGLAGAAAAQVADPAARHGASAASARSRRLLADTIDKRNIDMAGSDKVDPAVACLVSTATSGSSAQTAMMAWLGFQSFQKMLAREPDMDVPAALLPVPMFRSDL
jgi:hypothetical protein